MRTVRIIQKIKSLGRIWNQSITATLRYINEFSWSHWEKPSKTSFMRFKPGTSQIRSANHYTASLVEKMVYMWAQKVNIHTSTHGMYWLETTWSGFLLGDLRQWRFKSWSSVLPHCYKVRELANSWKVNENNYMRKADLQLFQKVLWRCHKELTSTLSGSLRGLSTALSASLLGSDWLLLRRFPPGPRWIFLRWGEASVTVKW